MNNLIPALVTGSWTDKVYPCYLDPNTHWNGFACPYFTQAVAEEVLSSATEQVPYSWEFDDDTFTVNHPDADEAEVYGGTPTEHGTLYAIGAWSWCWERVES